MCELTTLAMIGMAGAGLSAAGTYAQGQATAANARYQAQVAANNAQIARENAALSAQSGAARESAQGMKTAQSVGGMKAGQGASGIDVNTGSAAAVRGAAAKLGALDALTIRSNTSREVYGYEVEATNQVAKGKLLESEAKQAEFAGDIGALGTFLNGASSVGWKWKTMQLGGA